MFYCYLTVFTNFCTKIYFKVNKLFPYKSPESKFDLAINNSRSAQGNHLNILGCKSFTFREILCFSIFPYLIQYLIPPSNGHGQSNATIWTVIVLLKYTMPHIKFQGHRSIDFREEAYFNLLAWPLCWSSDLGGWMDDLQFYVLFNSISVILRRWDVDNERLCAMELRLWLRRFRLERRSNSVR